MVVFGSFCSCYCALVLLVFAGSQPVISTVDYFCMATVFGILLDTVTEVSAKICCIEL